MHMIGSYPLTIVRQEKGEESAKGLEMIELVGIGTQGVIAFWRTENCILDCCKECGRVYNVIECEVKYSFVMSRMNDCRIANITSSVRVVTIGPG